MDNRRLVKLLIGDFLGDRYSDNQVDMALESANIYKAVAATEILKTGKCLSSDENDRLVKAILSSTD